MNKQLTCLIALALFFIPAVFAEEQDDWTLFGLEGEKLFNLGSGLLATALFSLTILAYKRTRQKRLAWVSLAFFIFAAKSLLMSAEIFFGEWPWVDPVSAALDFAILLSFFCGLMRK